MVVCSLVEQKEALGRGLSFAAESFSMHTLGKLLINLALCRAKGSTDKPEDLSAPALPSLFFEVDLD